MRIFINFLKIDKIIKMLSKSKKWEWSNISEIFDSPSRVKSFYKHPDWSV